jgi:hypothetical protein
MPKLICPYCQQAGALLNPEIYRAGGPTSCAISCKNPQCRCYDPILYGYHPDMQDAHKKVYESYMSAMQRESDFDDIEILKEIVGKDFKHGTGKK